MGSVCAQPPAVEGIEYGRVEPACELEPEIHEEQGELHATDDDHGFQVIGAHYQYQRNADGHGHFQERQHHGQSLAHDIHGGEKAQRADGQSHVGGTAGHDIGDRHLDLAAVVGVDGALVHLLLTRGGDGAYHRVIDLALGQEPRPFTDAIQ